MVANLMMPISPIQTNLDVEVPTVFVIDPDPSTGKTVKELLTGARLKVQWHASGREFFAAYRPDQAGCLVLEQRIFDTSGLQIQRRLAEQHYCLPLVYVTSNIDVSTAVLLMRGGAVHVLEKPLRSMELLAAIQEALVLGDNRRRQEAEKKQVRDSIAQLTHKERQLVGMLASAKSTKTIALELSISSRAVELLRRGVMKKLGLDSSLELVRLAVLARHKFSRLFDADKAEMEDDGNVSISRRQAAWVGA